MIIIRDRNYRVLSQAQYETLGLTRIVFPFEQYQNLTITKKLDLDDKILSFEAPYELLKDYIELEGYIETQNDFFIIKEIEVSSDDRTVKVTAQLDLEDLEGAPRRKFEVQNQLPDMALRTAFAGTGWSIGLCNITKRRSLSVSGSALDVLKQAVDTYRAEIVIHTKGKTVDIFDKRGQDRGAYFISDLNLKNLTVQGQSYDYYTELMPLGKESDDGIVNIASVNSGQDYISDYTYSKKHKRLIWQDDRYTDPAILLEDAQYKLSDICKPYTSYEAEVVDLASISNGEYGILDFDIGDTITLIDGYTGTRQKQRIVEIVEHPDEPDKNTCTIANTILTFDEYTRKYNDAVETVDRVTSDNGTISGYAIDEIPASKLNHLELKELIATLIVADEIVAESARFEELTATVANIGTLNADTANIVTANVERLNAAEAYIAELQAANVTAGTARITNLEASYANIRNLIAGNATTGDLQTIVLGANNATIEQGFLEGLMAQWITVNDLLAGRISTDKFSIGSDDYSMDFDKGVAQWKDANDVVRIQIGMDAQGQYSFTIANENGDPIFYENGITSDGIPDSVIVNDMVAGDANISASKLDIGSVYNLLNASDPDHPEWVIKANKIYFDEKNQTLLSMFSDLTTKVTTASGKADAATAVARDALDVISGIDSLSAFTMSLSNDSHVIHTLTDGTGGDYSGCTCRVYAYLGDTNITSYADISCVASPGVTGTFFDNEYTVTGMSTDTGYVDFTVEYGYERRIITDRNSTYYYATRNNEALAARSDGLRLTKRFSISKARDGETGAVYGINKSVDTLLKNATVYTLSPRYVEFSAVYKTDVGDRPYMGVFVVEEQVRNQYGNVETQEMYHSPIAEHEASFYPSEREDLISVICKLYDTEEQYLLDTESVPVITDTANINNDVQSVRQEVAVFRQTINEFDFTLGSLQTDYYGVAHGALLLQAPYISKGTRLKFNAQVYRSGKDVTKTEFTGDDFSWYLRNDNGERYLGKGYTYTLDKSAFDIRLNSVMVCKLFVIDVSGFGERTGDNVFTISSGEVLTIRFA